MTDGLPWLSVVIPAYNEAERLGPSLREICAFLQTQPFETEVLVVNDGSSDRTGEMAAEILAECQQPGRVLHNPGNRGKGFSVRHGMMAATGNWRLMSDADLSTPIEEVIHLLRAAEECPVVIGSRGMKESRLEERQPWYRETMGRIFNLMVQAIALPGIQDSQCGFKLFQADAAQAIFSRLTIDGFGFDVESLFLARKLGYPVREVPIRWINHPASKVHALRDSSRMAADLVKVRIRHRGLDR